MTKKTDNLLPIGARVRVQDTHTGHVAGYGFIYGGVAPIGLRRDMATRECYLVRLDNWITEGRDAGMTVSVIVANPDNVKEA